jgi:gamma-glutamylcyclotransferase (GGCT)/AIG2-like uncharacterized protein YtfP
VPAPGTDRPPAGGLAIFVYGSLLDPAVLARQSGRRGLHRGAMNAVLKGWRRAMLRAAPYPTLLRDRHGQVAGLLLRLGGAALRRLVAYEGAAYALRPVRVRTMRGVRNCWAWIARPSLAIRGD